MKVDPESHGVFRGRMTPVIGVNRVRWRWVEGVLSLLGLVPISSYAQLGLVWDPNGASSGYGGSGNWTAAGTWLNPSTMPPSYQSWADGAAAGFGGRAGTVALDTKVTVANLGFDLGGYTISGSGTIRLQSPSGPSELGATAGVTTLDVRVEGSGGLTKKGAGTVVMNYGSAVEGGTLVSEGTLNVVGDYWKWSATTVRGEGSTLSCTEDFFASTLDVVEGGRLAVGGEFDVGNQIYSEVTVDHGSITANESDELSLWGYGGSANIIFRNGATGTFRHIRTSGPDSGSSCGISVGTGSTLEFAGMRMGCAPDGSGATYASLVVSGTSISPSHVNQTDPAAGLHVGDSAFDPFDPDPEPEAVFRLDPHAFYQGAGNTWIDKTGLFWMNGGSFQCAGDVTVLGRLTYDSGSFSMPAGSTFAVLEGGSCKFNSLFGFGGQTVNVSGTGSLLEAAGYLYLANLTANVSAGGRLSSNSGFFIGTLMGASLVDVSGNGTSLNCYGTGNSVLGAGSYSGNLTFREGANGTLGNLEFAEDCAGGGGYLNVISGATVSSRSISAVSGTPGTIGIVVSGNGSSLSQVDDSVNASFALGGSQDSAATFLVADSATFTSGSGTSTIHPTGTVQIHGGIYHAKGDLVLDGGTLSRDASGVLDLNPGKSLTVQNGGNATFTGNWLLETPATVDVTGGSHLEVTDVLAIAGGSNLIVSAGATVDTGYELWIGTMASGGGSASVSGVGSSIDSVSKTFIGWSGKTGQLAIGNNASAYLGRLIIAADATVGSSGSLAVNGGARVATGPIEIATVPGATTQGSITVTGSLSELSQVQGSGITLGSLDTSTATIQVTSGGTFESGGGTVMVWPTGNLMASGGHVLLHGLVVNHGTLQAVSGGLIEVTDILEHRGAISLADTGGTLRLLGEASLCEPISGMGTVDCRGKLMPGGTANHALVIGGNLVMSAGSEIIMQIGGLQRGIQFDSINVANTLTAAGRLKVTLVNGYQPQPGDSFDLFDGNLAGTFDVIAVPQLAPDLTWDTSDLMTTGVLRVVSNAMRPIEEWRNDHFGSPLNTGDGANNCDFDHDGWANLMEYAFGGDPTVADAAILVPTVVGGPADPSISFRCDEACGDLTYTVQTSSTLGGEWTDIAYSCGGGMFEPIAGRCTVEDCGTGLRVLTITANRLLFASGRGYFRIRLTAPDD